MSTALAFGAPASYVPSARLARVPLVAAVALVPWLLMLAARHETPWVVLDLAEFSVLLWLDALVRRRSAGAAWVGTAAALLLAGDALVDVAFAGPGHEVLAALAMAGCVELPLAAVCVLLGRTGFTASA
ncbi:hypothetical protein ACIBCA_25095 [Kitasatospora sp. NPDC051170]|uniref:hypothetical protein n=1 Tax=Kitasatospora sp. NPDC051170 TaxID=3364056 RepID=UPI0037920987